MSAIFALFIFEGPNANKYEKAKAIEFATHLDSDERSGKAAISLIQDEPKNPEFWALLGGYQPMS